MVSFINLQGPIPGKQIISTLTWYEKVIVLGDFNIEAENKAMKDFLQEHTFYNMMKQNTCFKGDRGSCIDLLITNSKFSFMKTNSFETGLSDHNHMIYTILKTKFDDSNYKPFWKARIPYFSNKNTNIQENIMLLEKDKLLSK